MFLVYVTMDADFLCNMNGYEMGFAVQRDGSGSARSSTQQEDEEDPLGIRVAGVELPPWASGSPREFIRLHRFELYLFITSQNIFLTA